MNTYFKNLLLTIISLILLSTLFTACNNFLSGSDLKKDIDAAIDYKTSNPFKVRFLGDNGKISPSGIIDYKATDQIPLLFSPDDEYDFVKWEILDTASAKPLTEQELKETIDMDNFDLYEPETTVKFLKNHEIIIKPVCVRRPSVISKTPQTQANGVFRSVRIWIMFDSSMDESSIYYSEDECKELENQGYVLIKDTNKSAERNGKCYGYWDGENNNSIVFKNISIKNKKTNENLLECFDAPYFDSEINDVLIVPTKKQYNETTDKFESLAPASGTYVLVELDKNFNYKENENKFVSMRGSERWSYLVNGNADTVAPSWTSLSVTGKDKSDLSRDLKQNTVPGDKDGYLATYIKDNKITVNGVISDGESGPAKVRLNYKQVKDGNNNSVTKSFPELILYPKIDGTDGTLSETINCESWENGIYELKFIAEDENGNESVYTPADSEIETTYILKNTFTPNLEVTENRNALTSANISVINNINPDFYESVSVTAKNVDDESATSITESVTGSSVNITGLEGYKHYQYTYEVKDIFGRSYSIESAVDRTPPEKPGEYIISKVSYTTAENQDGKVKVYWKTPSDTDVVRIFYRDNGKTEDTQKIEFTDITANAYTAKDVPLYRNGKRYTFDIYAVDFSGNISEPYSVSTKNYINSKGNVVFNDEEITYTSLAPVLTETTTYSTISKVPYNHDVPDYRGAFTDARGSSVTLEPYEMGKYLVTNRLYNLVSGELLGGLSSDPGWPICGVTYYHAVVFCNKLSIALGFKPCYSFGSHTVDEAYSWRYWAVNGRDMNLDNAFKDLKCDFSANGFRLPTELEWECCSRGADETKWEWKNCYAAKTDDVWTYYDKNGRHEVRVENSPDYFNSKNFNGDRATVYYIDNWLDHTCPHGLGSAYDVGQFKPTSTGHYDMSGLLWEWCWDTYEDITSSTGIYGKINSTNGKIQGNVNSGSYDAVRADRVLRGGHYRDNEGKQFWLFYRNHVHPHAGDEKVINWTQVGFRMCRTIESEE